MKLQDILKEYKDDSTLVTVEGHPVWDYKEGKDRGDIILISEDPWEGVESEYVTTGELFDFAHHLDIPFEDITLYTEADYEQLKTFTWLNNTLVLSHF